MQKIIRITAALSAAAIFISGTVGLLSDNAWARGGGGGRGGRVSVRGYYRSNGTYVSPYSRSAPGGAGFSGSSGRYSLPTDYTSFGMYMNWGYDATAEKNYELALYWFQQALDEKPKNPYALKAIQNIKKYARSTRTPSTSYAVSSVDMFETYMRSGYSASKSKIYDLALYYFKKALDERPNNPYAVKAIQNVQVYMQRNQW